MVTSYLEVWRRGGCKAPTTNRTPPFFTEEGDDLRFGGDETAEFKTKSSEDYAVSAESPSLLKPRFRRWSVVPVATPRLETSLEKVTIHSDVECKRFRRYVTNFCPVIRWKVSTA